MTEVKLMTDNEKKLGKTIEEKCIECNCSEFNACKGGCSWIPICSTCYDGMVKRKDVVKFLKSIRGIKKNWEAEGKNSLGKNAIMEITNSDEIIQMIMKNVIRAFRKYS